MDYKVVLPEKVARDLNRIPKKYRDQIFVALKGLEKSPFLGKKLWGQYDKYRSLRVGEYRIIYQFKTSELVMLIIKVGTRQRIYQYE